MIRHTILLKSLYVLFSLLFAQQTTATDSSSIEPSTVPVNPPVQAPLEAKEKAPTIPVSPPAKASEDAAPSAVKAPSPDPPKQKTPEGFIVSDSNNCKMTKSAGRNSGPDDVSGDSGKGSSGKGSGSSGKGDSAGDSSSAADESSGKAGGANRYRYHQRRRTSKETKHRRKLQPSPSNATSKNSDAEDDGVKSDSAASDGCDETQTDALSVDSGAMRQGTFLGALMLCMVGGSFLLR